MPHASNVVHVTSLGGEDHWSVQTQAKSLVPRREERRAARSLMGNGSKWEGTNVLWWHPMYFDEARRTEPPFPADETRNLVMFHHDRLGTVTSPCVHGATAESASVLAALKKTAAVPVFRVRSGGVEDARPHYDPASRKTPIDKVWLGIIGGGGSPMQTKEGFKRVRKGQDLFVPLAERLDPSKYAWTFIGPHWDTWCEQLRALGFEVFAPGYTAPGGQYVHFREVDIYLMISRLEGNPLPLLETMGCGIWPIAAPAGIAPEVIESGVNGTLLRGWEAAEILDAISAVDRRFLAAHRSQVVESVSEWTWQRFAADVRTAMHCVFGRS